MKKLIFALLAMISTTTFAQDAQNEGVNFLDNRPLAEAIELAKQQGKKVFVDCYTTWCGPCRNMTNQVFPQKVCGDYFNAEFVNLKVDMEKGEGTELQKRFKVTAFPTFLILDTNERLIGRVVGGDKAESFIEKVKESMSEGGLAAMQDRFEAGERDREFLIKYLNMLTTAHDQEGCATIANLLIEGHTEELLNDEQLYNVFMRNTNEPNEAFLYVWKNRKTFAEKYDRSLLDRFITKIWTRYPQRFVNIRPNAVGSYDAEGMAAYVKLMKDNNVPDADQILANTEIEACAALQQWDEYIAKCKQFEEAHGVDEQNTASWCYMIAKLCREKETRAIALQWATKHKEALEAAKSQPSDDPSRPALINDITRTYDYLIKELSE